jgi:hypothetical protein
LRSRWLSESWKEVDCSVTVCEDNDNWICMNCYPCDYINCYCSACKSD